MDVFKWLWRYVKKYRFRLFGGLILALLVSGMNMINPYLTGVIVDKVILGGQTGLLLTILMIMVGATLFRTIIRYAYQIIFEHISQNTIFNIRDEIYKKLQELDFSFFDKTRTGDIMARMTGDIDAVRHFIAGVIYSIFENLAIFIFALFMLCSINLTLALILLAITPVTGFLTFKMAGLVKPAFSAIREQFSRLNTVVQENISGNRVVKAFAKEEYETEKFSKENDGFRDANLDAAIIWEKYLPLLDSIASALSVVLILVGGIMVIKGTLSLGELVTFNSFVWALNNPLRMAGWLVNDLQRFVASADKIIALMKTKPKIKNSVKPVEINRIKGKVEFKNVSFGYGDGKILEDISFVAEPGQTVAFIGPTGSGKSTLVSLICRFYDCSSGEVLIDGENIKEIDLRTLRENVSIAMQDVFLFSDTIEGNIAYGVPDAPIEQVQRVAHIASAHEFITDFPEGYDTIIGERGVGLSGGQKQRIALARALVKKSSILILDDITASVDIETEQKIHSMLKSFYADRTTFIIAHRISTIKNADIIFVLDNGRIIEQGNHQELISRRGYYYNVFVNQCGDFDNIYTMEVGLSG